MARILTETSVQELWAICREFTDDETISSLLWALDTLVRGDPDFDLQASLRQATEGVGIAGTQALQLSLLLSHLLAEQASSRLFLTRLRAPVSWEGQER
jgi:hypothetical protein